MAVSNRGHTLLYRWVIVSTVLFVICCLALVLLSPSYRMTNIQFTAYTHEDMAKTILGPERGDIFNRDQEDPKVAAYKPKTFKYLLNNESLCTSLQEQPTFLLWIYSAPKHVELRNALRQTWARPGSVRGYPSVTVFLVGTALDTQTMAAIKIESLRFGDVVQVDYVETYHKLPYKGITALRWTTEFCRKPPFIVKADDDLFVDIQRVIQVIKDIEYKIKTKEIHGKVAAGMVSAGLEVPRNWEGLLQKVNVKNNVLPESKYLPTYLFGWTYILTNNMIPDLYKAALKTPIFQIEDVFLTGMLISQVPNVTMLNVENKRPVDGSGPERFYFSTEAKTPDNIIKMWCDSIFGDFTPNPLDPCVSNNSKFKSSKKALS